MKPFANLPFLAVPHRGVAAPTADPANGFWSTVPTAELHQVVTGAPPVQPTRVRSAWTPLGWHVLFEVQDDYVWATLTERDAKIYTEEVVEVFVDPVGDLGAYFEVEISPIGTVLDLIVRRTPRGLVKDFRWQCAGLQQQVARTAGGWNAELVLPWEGLAAEPPRGGEKWRANFCRIDRPQQGERELTAWSPTGVALFHVPESFGIVEFQAP